MEHLMPLRAPTLEFLVGNHRAVFTYSYNRCLSDVVCTHSRGVAVSTALFSGVCVEVKAVSWTTACPFIRFYLLDRS